MTMIFFYFSMKKRGHAQLVNTNATFNSLKRIITLHSGRPLLPSMSQCRLCVFSIIAFGEKRRSVKKIYQICRQAKKTHRNDLIQGNFSFAFQYQFQFRFKSRFVSEWKLNHTLKYSLNHCSDETTAVNHSTMITQITASDCDAYGWRRPRSESSADAESMYMTNPVLSDSGFAQQSRRSSVSLVYLDIVAS